MMFTNSMQLVGRSAALAAACAMIHLSLPAADQTEVQTLAEVKAAQPGGLYPHNRVPLVSSPFLKLPIGSITPHGWVHHMLELERDGMTGHLKEISPWLDFSKSSWGDKEGRGRFGWEEMPYWLKGYGDLGYLLRDESIMAETKKWIESALASQREDGWFGPRELLTSLGGKPDLWPHMVMLNVFQSYYEFSGDARIIECMTKYMLWENTLPVSAFGEGYWPKIRAGDNIESAHWLFNRTGQLWLLELCQKIHAGMARWDRDVIDWHNVNLSQGFRAGTVFWEQSKNPSHLASAERNYQKVMGLYGQFPGGGFVGDENSRPGFIDPRGGIETCGIVEFMHSFEMLTKITGNPIWIDRCEEIAFNSFPASMPADQKGLHYITTANQVQLDRHNKAPGIQNGGTMFSYSPFEVYRCCQHNVSHGWPYYAEEIWLATYDNGLCASLYAASEVNAKVGAGTPVKIVEETDYPFSDTVTFKVSPSKAVRFPLYLRTPHWCENPSVKINGATLHVKPEAPGYVILDRTWAEGDQVTLTLPMRISTRTWKANKDSLSVDYGPLSYSLKIEERWEKYGNRNPNWPEWEVFPASPWNYGLVVDAQNPAKSFEVVRKAGATPEQPWTAASVPISLRAKARKIAAWEADKFQMVGKLQPSPVKSDAPVETVTLIPMGAARLRISSFPVIGDGPDAQEWTKAPVSALNASHSHESDSLEAVNDGLVPKSSNDGSIPRFTWWDHRGTSEWIEWGFPKIRKASAVEVYWFDDTGKGQCRVPASWKLSYRVGEAWKPVEEAGAFGTKLDAFNRVSFKPVECNGLRIEVQLQPEFSGGILEWRIVE